MTGGTTRRERQGDCSDFPRPENGNEPYEKGICRRTARGCGSQNELRKGTVVRNKILTWTRKEPRRIGGNDEIKIRIIDNGRLRSMQLKVFRANSRGWGGRRSLYNRGPSVPEVKQVRV